MTHVYFVRHAEADNNVRDDLSRPLTEKGMRDRTRVSHYLKDKGITAIVSSPYKRAHDTVAEFAQSAGLDIIHMEQFQERRIADVPIEDFAAFSKQQWADFSYKREGGESLGEVQQRTVKALFDLIETHPSESIVIGTHGTALSTVLHYFDKTFLFDSFTEIAGLMPWIVYFQFDGNTCVAIRRINLFDPTP